MKDDDDADNPVIPPTSIYIPTGGFDSYMSTEAQQVKQSMLQREGTFSYTSRTSGYGAYEPEYSSDSYRPVRCDTAIAINVKTGSSLFSLDLPQNKGAVKKSIYSQPKSSKKSKGVKKSSKDKKGKKTSSSSASNCDMVEFESEFESLHLSSDQRDIDETGSSSEDEDTDSLSHDVLVFQDKAGSTKGVYRFEKLAYPDLVGARGCPYLEPLFRRKFGVQR